MNCRVGEKLPCGDWRIISDANSMLQQTLPYPDRWRVLPLLFFPLYVHHLTAIGPGRDARTAIYGTILFLRSCASKLLAEVTHMNTITTTPTPAFSGGTRASWTLVYLLFVP